MTKSFIMLEGSKLRLREEAMSQEDDHFCHRGAATAGSAGSRNVPEEVAYPNSVPALVAGGG